MNNFDIREWVGRGSKSLLKENYDPPKRYSISELDITDKFLEFIKRRESYRRNAYPDGEFQDGSLRYSIGYGSQKYYDIPGKRNGTWVKEGETIDRETATDLLRSTLERYANEMDRYVNVDLSQSEFEASLSFMYNVGGVNFKSSSFLKELNKGNYEQAPELLKNWHRGWYDGESRRHLLDDRREAEIDLYLTDINKAKTSSGVDTDTKPEIPATELNDVFAENGVAYGYDSVLNYLIGKYPEQELRIRDFIEDNYNSFFNGTIDSKDKLENSYKDFLQDPVDVVDTVEKEPASTAPDEVEPVVEPKPIVRRIKDDPGQNVRKVQDTEAPEVTTEPFKGNVVKVIEPKNPTADVPVEVTKEKLVFPFFKKIEGILASVWDDKIKGFFQEDLKNLFKKLYDPEQRKLKQIEKLYKKQKSKEIQEFSPEDIKNNSEALDAYYENITNFDILIPSNVPQEYIDRSKVKYPKSLEAEILKSNVSKQLNTNVVDDWKKAVDDVNDPFIRGTVIRAASKDGPAAAFNTLVIDGQVETFLKTYDEYIDRGVFFYQDLNGEWKHNTPKLQSQFYRYTMEQIEKHSLNTTEWETELPKGVTFKDVNPDNILMPKGGIQSASPSDAEPNAGADMPASTDAGDALDVLNIFEHKDNKFDLREWIGKGKYNLKNRL